MDLGTEILFVLRLGLLALGPKQLHTLLRHAPDCLGLCSFADTLLTVTTKATVKRANVHELNSRTVLVLDFVHHPPCENSLTGVNGRSDLFNPRRECDYWAVQESFTRQGKIGWGR